MSNKERSVLHLPKTYAGMEPKKEVETLRVERSISAMQATEMIANQQGKMVKLVMLLGEMANVMHKRDEIRAKAVNFAAKKAAELKTCRNAWDVIHRSYKRQLALMEAFIIILLYKSNLDEIEMSVELAESIDKYKLHIDDTTPGKYKAQLSPKLSAERYTERKES